MQPRVQYVRRADGARIAYATMGSGPVLVFPPGHTTSMEWLLGDTEAQERFFQRIAEVRSLVLYDRHGCGLSDRNRRDFSLEDDMLDIEAVVDATEAETIDLFAASWGGTPAIVYAARHLERVRRMVLFGTYAAGPFRSDAGVDQRRALSELRRVNWELYCRTRASQFFPSGTDRETFQSLVRMMRDSTSPTMAEKLDEVAVSADTQSLLHLVQTPTLVLHRRGDEVCPFAWGQYLARRLPNARFMPLEGDTHYMWVGDADSVLRPTVEFLTEGETHASAASSVATHAVELQGMAVILFADIAGSTALTEELGDSAFREKARTLDTDLRAAISRTGGTPIDGKVLGDGVMAVFTSARQAVDAAVACRSLSERSRLPLHLGIHAGDVIREANTVYGGAVNIAARIADACAPGEITVSDTVRSLARTSAGVTFEGRGEHHLKGIDEPVRLFAVRRSG